MLPWPHDQPEPSTGREEVQYFKYCQVALAQATTALLTDHASCRLRSTSKAACTAVGNCRARQPLAALSSLAMHGIHPTTQLLTAKWQCSATTPTSRRREKTGTLRGASNAGGTLEDLAGLGCTAAAGVALERSCLPSSLLSASRLRATGSRWPWCTACVTSPSLCRPGPPLTVSVGFTSGTSARFPVAHIH